MKASKRLLRVGLVVGFALVLAGCEDDADQETPAGGGQGPGTATPSDAPKEITLDLGGGVSMKLVLIPAGSFRMGCPPDEQGRSDDEGPQHQVTISRAFYVGATEVTQAQWQAVMGTTIDDLRKWVSSSYRGEGDDYPVYCLTWEEADAYRRKLAAKTGKPVRLPTEAEWEYACRAGTRTRFCCGDADSELRDYAWYATAKTHPVGQKKPNAFGLYDVHGNVSEWCSDRYGPYTAEAAVDPQGAAGGDRYVIRGGNWYTRAKYCRSAARDSGGPKRRSASLGFRIAADLSAGAAQSE